MGQITSSIGTIGPAQDNKQMKINDLKSLIELGSIKEEVVVGDQKFVLKTANALERIRLSKLLVDKPTAEQYFEFELHILAGAIESVNGLPLESYHPDSTVDVLERKIDILSVFQRPVIEFLIEKYNDMILRSDKQFSGEDVKK